MSEKKENGGWVDRFKRALQQAEQTRDAVHVASLFADGAPLANLGGDHGHDALEFWKTYLQQFDEISSDFTGETVTEKSAALEWRSRGTAHDGTAIDYRGISVIEWNGDTLSAFRTYYDSAAFVQKAGVAR